jgi:membrane-bound metal-dependent hydrolase YbcI (DUF457 family)
MPNYKGHLVGGVVAYGFFLCLLYSFKPSFVTAAEWLLFTIAGALFPDIDIKSKGQKYFYYLVFILFLLLVFRQQLELMACFSFLIIVPMLSRHRGVFHRFWFVVSMPLFVWMLIAAFKPSLSSPLFFNTLFFIIGALSHIFLDYGPRRMLHNLFTRRKKSLYRPRR